VSARRPVRASSDLASLNRKRALRRLARQEYDAYRDLYAALTSEGYVRHQARGRAWTQLRQQFPDAYLELYALEQVGPGHEASPEIRSKSWQRAMALLGDLRKAPYREHYERFLADGLTMPDAAYRATEALRVQDPELFARLLAAEIRMWQSVAGEPGDAAPPASRPDGGTARADFHAACHALEREADVAASEPGRDPALLYATLTERVTELAASIRAGRESRPQIGADLVR
jgi:hypothetical protein